MREVRATSRRRSGGERGDRTGGVGERAKEHLTMSRRRSGGGRRERANGARATRATNERSEAERAEERAQGSQVLIERIRNNSRSKFTVVIPNHLPEADVLRYAHMPLVLYS